MGRGVDGAEGADRPALRLEGDARIGDHAEVGDGWVVAQERGLSRIRDDQGLSGNDDVLAERVRERRLAARGPRLSEADGALEELPPVVDQRHQDDRFAEQPRRQAGPVIEVLLRWTVE